MTPKICGTEYAEFMICGIKKSKTVLEKWPRIPTTAKVIPAKYVYVSPTNTLLGYLEITKILIWSNTNYDIAVQGIRQ
jgi:hypothetical protein